MGQIAERLRRCLEGGGIPFETIQHAPDVRAEETATDTGTPPEEFAKTVFICADGHYAMAVLPAHLHVSPKRMASALGAGEVRLASEDESERLCPDCEVGAAPPFGNLYDLPVYVSPALARDERITFNAGRHDVAVRMRYRDYARVVHPQVVSMARRETPAL